MSSIMWALGDRERADRTYHRLLSYCPEVEGTDSKSESARTEVVSHTHPNLGYPSNGPWVRTANSFCACNLNWPSVLI